MRNLVANSAINYRPDIDGLRAIAVLGVILFHINPSSLSGGFLGVDVFFVISGYLISGLLIKNATQSGKLEILEFYKRRIKRIFPALLFVLLGTLTAGFVLLAPQDFSQLSIAAIWSLFSAANIYFFASVETGYFAADSAELPLLHLWSLGVEEQFYILWPFAVFALMRYTRSLKIRIAAIVILAAASLVLAQSLIGSNQSFAYYMLPTRAWELLAGGGVALLTSGTSAPRRIYTEVLACLGVVLVISGFAFISENDAIPGLAAVPSVVGASFLMLSGPSTYVGRLLAMKPLVAIGLLSYSAYLWHWPIIAFTKYSLVQISVPVGAAIIFTTLLMAAVSYYFVETPLRRQSAKNKTIFVWYFAVPVSATSLFLAFMIQSITHKNEFLYPWNEYAAIETSTQAAFAYDFNCQYSNFKTEALYANRCVFPENSSPAVLLIGDSNAAHYLGMIRVFANHFGFSLRNATQSACPLIFSGDYEWISKRYRKGCDTYRAAIAKEVKKYDTIIVGGAWDIYQRIGGDEFEHNFAITISNLAGAGKQVTLLAKNPTFTGYNTECELRAVRIQTLDCASRFTKPNRAIPVNKFMRSLADKYSNVHYLDVRPVLCKDSYCSPYFDGLPVYFDAGHLSMIGSERLGRAFIQSHYSMLEAFQSLDSSHGKLLLQLQPN